MRIFLTGATGFIGGHLLRALVERGHQVTCLVRSAAALDALALPGVSTVVGEFTQPQGWRDRLDGMDAVINCVGIIRETSVSGYFEKLHTLAPIALFDAAKASGVGKIVQLSALGADDGAQSIYHVSKRAADAHLGTVGVPYVI